MSPVLTPSAAVPRHPTVPPVLLIFLAALLARTWVLWRATGVPYFLPTHGDMKFYSEWAQRIAAGTWTDHQAFYGMPLYAYLLAAVYWLVGFQPYLALLPQVLAEAFTATLVFRLAGLCFRGAAGEAGARRIGVFAALGWVLFVPAQAFGTILMPTTYLILAFWFVVWWTVSHRAAGRLPGSGQYLWLGALMGVTAMMVANILLLLPLVIVSAFLRPPGAGGDRWAWRGPGGRRALAGTALLLAGVGIGTAPCWVHNRFVAGEKVFLSAHSGVNFYIGNHPGANGYPSIPAGLRGDQAGMLEDSVSCAERAAGRPLRRAEVSAYWSGQAKAFIREQPVAWLRLQGVKARNFWSAFSYDDLSIISALREDGVTLPGPGFGLVALLALPGVALAAVRVPAARWVIAAVLLHLSSLLTVFVTERYRMAAAPGLLLMAGYGLWQLARWAGDQRWRGPAVYAGLLVVAGLLVYWPQRDPSLLALDDYNTAVTDLKTGRLKRAAAKLDRVLARCPDNADVQFVQGNLRMAQGRREEAKRAYRRAVELNPRHASALNNLGWMAMEENRWDVAERLLGGSLRVNPTDANSHFLMAKVCSNRHDLEAARGYLTEALRLEPGREDFLALRETLGQP